MFSLICIILTLSININTSKFLGCLDQEISHHPMVLKQRAIRQSRGIMKNDTVIAPNPDVHAKAIATEIVNVIVVTKLIDLDIKNLSF